MMTLSVLAAAPSPAGSLAATILPLVLMFAIFYFMLIRPQKKQERAHAA